MRKNIYSPVSKRIVHKLKLARKQVGFDQKQVAKHLGVTQSLVSKIESGQVRLDVTQLLELARLYKKHITFFLEQ